VSLINDALKRARQAQTGPPSLPGDSQLKPVAGLPAKPSEMPVLIVIGVLAVLGVSALIVTFVVLKRNQTPFLAAAPEQTVVAAALPGSPTLAASPKPQAVTPTSMPLAPSPAPVVAAQSAKLPLPKLQGIFSSRSRPWALVDDKTVFVGDHVGDFQVLAIGQNTVTLGGGGQTNVLTLQE
jgi:hypothetical protein